MASYTNQPILIATDGSKDNGKGSYAWVLATPLGDILAQGWGTVYTYKISSFRCKSYAILAALQFIIQLCCFYFLPSFNPTTIWWCDCKSLLQRIQSGQSPIPNPNRFKLAEHDVEHSVIASLPIVSTRIQPCHLHSHQNDKASLMSLPLNQRLNCIADHLAKEHNKTIDYNTNKTPLIHLAACQLNLHKSTITLSLQHAYSQHASTSHLQQRLQLPIGTIDLIA